MARQDDMSVSCGCGGRLAVGRLPFQLGGHCSGCGIIADTARQLPSLENSATLFRTADMADRTGRCRGDLYDRACCHQEESVRR